ncbi:unnamed protein product [Miscanthus lutarioriparius]|uniref:Peroxidase n=1 Tax=Miscanthus lutarioriparius TaxID=422564 RepID=A0A811MN76_9POAL|nr:unnamed protein product [Miscanthus lutarioriparius]
MSCLALLAVLCLGAAAVARGQLTDDFYDGCCPQAEDIVKARVSAAMKAEPRMGASLLRLHFHDCFVNSGGPDYGVLLGRRDGLVANQSGANSGLPSPFDPIDTITKKFSDVDLNTTDVVVLSGNKGTRSREPIYLRCARILKSATNSGGPRWRVPLGRRDGTTANITAANNLPSPFDNLTTLQQKFGAVGLGNTDLVALSGSLRTGKTVRGAYGVLNSEEEIPASPGAQKKRMPYCRAVGRVTVVDPSLHDMGLAPTPRLPAVLGPMASPAIVVADVVAVGLALAIGVATGATTRTRSLVLLAWSPRADAQGT